MECPQPLIESKMVFIPPAKGCCFPIEHFCQQRGKQLQNVKTAEFILLHSPTKPNDKFAIWVVEAKSSTPKPATQPDFNQFIDEISQKLTNGLLLFQALMMGRHGKAGQQTLPEPFSKIDLKTIDFKLILVINGHKTEWLAPLNDKLTQAMKPLVKVWALSATAVTVLNDELARKKGLIQ